MTVKTEQPKTMREVLGMLESRLNGKRVFRYMDDGCITEISAERFFHDIRAAAAVLRKGNLAGRHIGIMGRNSYGWLVTLCAVFLTESAAVLLDREISSGELAVIQHLKCLWSHGRIMRNRKVRGNAQPDIPETALHAFFLHQEQRERAKPS